MLNDLDYYTYMMSIPKVMEWKPSMDTQQFPYITHKDKSLEYISKGKLNIGIVTQARTGNNDENNISLLDSLLQLNTFSTNDKYLNYQYLTLKANYYLKINDFTNAESLFKKSMNFVKDNSDLYSRSALYLIDIYLKNSNIKDAQRLINSISKDDLSFNYVNKYERYKYKIDYLTK